MRPTICPTFRSTLSLLLAVAAAMATLGGGNLAIAGNTATQGAKNAGAGTPNPTGNPPAKGSIKPPAKRFIKAERRRPTAPKLTILKLIGNLKTEVRRADGRIFSEVIEVPEGSQDTPALALRGLVPLSAVPFTYQKGFHAADGSRNHQGIRVSRERALVSKGFDVNGMVGTVQTVFSKDSDGADLVEHTESITRNRADASPQVSRSVSRVDGKIRIESSYSRELFQIGAVIEYHRNEAENGDDATHTFEIRTLGGNVYVSIALDPKGTVTVDAKNMKAGPQGRLSIEGSKVAVSSLKQLIQGSKQLSATDKARLEASLDAAHASAF